MGMDEKKLPLKEIPAIITNPQNGQKYSRGKFLGKGGFARCYEMIDINTKQVFAGKIVPKTMLMKPHQRDKMTQEIDIHRSLSHPHVVRLDGYFEDSDNVYVLLELCARRSLMELHKRRKAVTEPEARYFTYQVFLYGCSE
ncbi:hypothetical protein AB6A40_011122 [Gnathostoma spinigerum]|uniref:Protein kinase domain-containing protein n=1 Tax=Gnathostoma spinigerum TaxID=75299 RepID=A0ABD6EWS2_9BILA